MSKKISYRSVPIERLTSALLAAALSCMTILARRRVVTDSSASSSIDSTNVVLIRTPRF